MSKVPAPLHRHAKFSDRGSKLGPIPSFDRGNEPRDYHGRWTRLGNAMHKLLKKHGVVK